MGSQWTHDGQIRQNVVHVAFTEDVKVAENIQTWWDIETCFENQRRQSVKKGTAGREDAREYDEVHRRTILSGKAVE